MATKIKPEVLVKSKKKFPELGWAFSQFPGCCGIGVVHGFHPPAGGYNWNAPYGTPGYGKYNKAELIYETKQQQIDSVYASITEQTHYTQLLISLVSCYSTTGQHQCQELEDLLLDEGWTIHSVFVNPNHGNEVTLYGKYFPENHKEDASYDDEDVYPEDSSACVVRVDVMDNDAMDDVPF